VPRPRLLVEPARRLFSWRWTLFDIALAFGLLGVTLSQRTEEAGLAWWIAAVPLVAGLVVRRHRPLLGFLLASGGALGHHLDPGIGLEALDYAVPLTLYTLASTGRSRRTAAIALGALLIGVGALSTLHVIMAAGTDRTQDQKTSYQSWEEVLRAKPGYTPGPEADAEILARTKPFQPPPTVNDVLTEAVGQGIAVMLVFGLAFAVGDSVRSRRAHLYALEQRAVDLEREQHQRVALATAAERARISRELHDVVAHGLSVIVVQAQGAAAALERHPDRAAEALQNVIATGRDSLGDMRRLLDLVRRDPTEDAALAPAVGVAYLPDLVERIRSAGTPASLVITGDPVPLPASVDLSAYRIVQEALTNTLKHAGPGAGVVVRLDFAPERLELEVVDDGVGGPAGEDGTGLRGIAERVGMLGGEWSAGPAPERGFRVWASLPVQAPS